MHWIIANFAKYAEPMLKITATDNEPNVLCVSNL